jgi:hypothetical protein
MAKVKDYNKLFVSKKKIKIIFLTKEACGGTGSLLKQLLKLDDLFIKKFFAFRKTPSLVLNKNVFLINTHYPSSVKPIGYLPQKLHQLVM